MNEETSNVKRRVYMDISGDVDNKLALAALQHEPRLSKKALLEKLVTDYVASLEKPKGKKK